MQMIVGLYPNRTIQKMIRCFCKMANHKEEISFKVDKEILQGPINQEKEEQ